MRPGQLPRFVGRGVIAAAVSVTVAVTGCAPLPATGPQLATDGGPRATEGGEESDPTRPSRPDWVAPTTDLDWFGCATGRSTNLTEDVSVSCAMLDETPVLRITSDDTPEDAAPLVVVAGPETPPDSLSIRLAAGGTELTDAHPLVVVDHRGRSGPAGHCLSFPARRTLDGLADDGVDPVSPAVRADLADTAQSCTDQIMGHELDFGARGAAEDLERLRQHWDVPGLALMGIGSGARTALSYASTNPGRVSLLVLDSPAPAEGHQETAARAALAGSDAALRLWASMCVRPECGPGDADQKVDAISAALEHARGPRATIPAALLSDVVRMALGDISGASGLAAAPGDVILGDLVEAAPGEIPASVRDAAERLTSTSLPYVAGCSDLSERVPVSRIPELISEWEDTPPFGEIIGAQLSACSTWPVPPPAPIELPETAPVLLLGSIADPVAGAGAMEPTAGKLTAAGAPEVRMVTWGAPGSTVVLHSRCARTAVATFLDDPSAAEDTACPS